MLGKFCALMNVLDILTCNLNASLARLVEHQTFNPRFLKVGKCLLFMIQVEKWQFTSKEGGNTIYDTHMVVVRVTGL